MREGSGTLSVVCLTNVKARQGVNLAVSELRIWRDPVSCMLTNVKARQGVNV